MVHHHWLSRLGRILWRACSALLAQWKALLTFAVIVAGWQIWTSIQTVPSYILPSPRAIVGYMSANPAYLLSSAAVTLREVAMAFALSLGAGVGLAILIDQSRFLAQTMLPILVTTQVVPTIAIAPLLVLWLGFGDAPKIAVAFLVSFFPIVVNTVTGLKAVSEDLDNLATSLCATRWQRLRLIKIPTAVPYIFAGARVAITLAVIGAVVGEFVAADQGLGYLVLQGSARLQPEELFAAIVVLALVGIALFNLVRVVERLLVSWEPQGAGRYG